MSRSRNHRRVSIRPNLEQWAKLAFLCQALRVPPAEFFLSLIPIHYDELVRMLDQVKKEAGTTIVTQEEADAVVGSDQPYALSDAVVYAQRADPVPPTAEEQA